MLKSYLQNLHKSFQKGDAREESYYEHLVGLLREYSQLHRKRKIDVTILPRKTEAGNPDFRIWDGKQKVIGYIEAKDLGVGLDRVEERLQVRDENYGSPALNKILAGRTH